MAKKKKHNTRILCAKEATGDYIGALSMWITSAVLIIFCIIAIMVGKNAIIVGKSTILTAKEIDARINPDNIVDMVVDRLEKGLVNMPPHTHTYEGITGKKETGEANYKF